MEEWRAVVGWEGRYEVSDEGRVRSVASRWGPRPRPIVLHPFLSGREDRGKKRLAVRLHGDGRPAFKAVHRLVLEAFRGPCPDGMQGRHLDDDVLNNRLGNLVWGTPLENAADARRNGIRRVGERNGRATLTADNVRDIRRRLAAGEVQQRLADEFGVSQGTISGIKIGRLWSEVT